MTKKIVFLLLKKNFSKKTIPRFYKLKAFKESGGEGKVKRLHVIIQQMR